MQLEFEIEDPRLLASGLSHALSSYGDVVSATFFGCELPSRFEEYFQEHNIDGLDERHEHLKKRWNAVKDILDQLDEQIVSDSATNKAESE